MSYDNKDFFLRALETELEGTIIEYQLKIENVLTAVIRQLEHLGPYAKECTLEELATKLEGLITMIDHVLVLKPVIKDLQKILED